MASTSPRNCWRSLVAVLATIGLPTAAQAQSFFPGGGTYDAGTQLQVRVEFCSGGGFFDSQGTVSLNGSIIGSTSHGSDPGCTDFQSGVFTIPINAGDNILSAQISDNLGSYYGEETYVGYVPPPPPPAPPLVTPDGEARLVRPLV